METGLVNPEYAAMAQQFAQLSAQYVVNIASAWRC